MINTMKPDLLNERLKSLAPIVRSDVSQVQGDVVLDILKEKGIVREG